jgi:hypothetical protein
MNCTTIDGISYLKRDYSIQCWKDYHIKVVKYIVIPIIVIWILAFPLLVFFILLKNKKNLDSPDILIKYGMFFIGLKDEYFYWEIIIVNIRKVVATAIAVSLN